MISICLILSRLVKVNFLSRIKDAHAAAVIDQLMQMNALEFMDTDKDFALSEKQIALLDLRSKTPIDQSIPADESIKQLKRKYGL